MNLAARPISLRALLGGAGALALSGSLTVVLSACGSQAETVTSTGPTIELVTPNYAPHLQTYKLPQQISLALRGTKSPADALNAAAAQAKALL
ncbi:hypothetical protein [Nocardia sp. NPDC059239]|uniref:hypothetical protein n=1 Tax=Nocardia sp. NPDC059239 TaxID=3346785 RepID=UPI0036B8108F